MNDLRAYPLGHSDAEERRLALQASIFETLTEDVFRRSGLASGMKVLDVGCGAGDVSMLAARLVGPNGSVLGVDRNAGSLETARRRSQAAQLQNIRFVATELSDFKSEETFDAIVGRLILLYLPDPSAIIRNLLAYLRPGGTVAFHEMDMSSMWASNPTRLQDRVANWIIDAFAFSGIAVDMGSKLPAIFKSAGLPCPDMIAGQRVDGAPDSVLYAFIAGTLTSLLPTIERANIASSAEVDIDTLADRMRAEALQCGHVIYTPRLVGAWVKKP